MTPINKRVRDKMFGSAIGLAAHKISKPVHDKMMDQLLGVVTLRIGSTWDSIGARATPLRQLRDQLRETT